MPHMLLLVLSSNKDNLEGLLSVFYMNLRVPATLDKATQEGMKSDAIMVQTACRMAAKGC